MALAEGAAGSEEVFAEMMNEKREIGMQSTNFSNSSESIAQITILL